MTNTAGALQYAEQMIHYLRLDMTYADKGKVKVIGVVPAGSLILKPISGFNVSQVFNDSGTNTVDMGIDDGTTNDPDLLATAMLSSAVGFIPMDEAVSFYIANDSKITATYNAQNSDPTTGKLQAVVCFIPPALT